jgi:hypothetical protein
MRTGDREFTGQVRNISFDGALVKVEGEPSFASGDLGAKLELRARGDGVPELRSEAKLVRLFEEGGNQYAAIRFLDYMG